MVLMAVPAQTLAFKKNKKTIPSLTWKWMVGILICFLLRPLGLFSLRFVIVSGRVSLPLSSCLARNCVYSIRSMHGIYTYLTLDELSSKCRFINMLKRYSTCFQFATMWLCPTSKTGRFGACWRWYQQGLVGESIFQIIRWVWTSKQFPIPYAPWDWYMFVHSPYV